MTDALLPMRTVPAVTLKVEVELVIPPLPQRRLLPPKSNVPPAMFKVP